MLTVGFSPFSILKRHFIFFVLACFLLKGTPVKKSPILKSLKIYDIQKTSEVKN